MLPPCCHGDPGILLWQDFYRLDALPVTQTTAAKQSRLRHLSSSHHVINSYSNTNGTDPESLMHMTAETTENGYVN